MPTQVQFRRGTTAQNNSFTGAAGELSVDTTLNVLRLHDGSTAGGHALVSGSSTITLTNKTINLSSNTLTGTIAQFNTALSDADFATIAGSETLTNKTLTTPVIAEIDNASDITLDAGGDIILDADGADVLLKDGGTTFGSLSQSGGELVIKSGSTPTTAITMSGANVTIAGNLTVSGSTTTVSSNTVSIGDSTILLNGDATGSASENAGIEVERGDDTNVLLRWNESTDTWQYTENGTDYYNVVGTSATQTLTNKTLTSPVISTISNTGTLTLPTSTDTLVGRATTDTLTNKTINIKTGQGNTFQIQDNSITSYVGTGANVVLSQSPTITSLYVPADGMYFNGTTGVTQVAASTTASGTLTLPAATDTLVGRATTDTLTNKSISLTTNTITGTTAEFNTALTDGNFATQAGTETLTNKTISVDDNTVSGVAASSFVLSNSSGYIDGSAAQKAIPTGTVVGTSDSQTLTNKTIALGSNTVTGTIAEFNSAVTDADFATIAGVETLTNKTLTSPVVTGLTLNDASIVFEGATANDFETTVTVTDPTADRTITIPDVTGTVVTTGDTGTVTSTMIADGTIVNADISGSASIAVSKLAASTISGITLGGNLATLTIGTGLSGTSYNGSSAVTIAIDSTVATLTGTQTLTGKTIALGSNTVSGTIAEFNTAVTDADFATLAGSETLTNKTLTSPVISTISNTGTLTLPTSTDTLVGRATTDTLTNKSISGSTNTLSNIGNSSLTNSSITINGTSTALGGTRTLVTDDIAEDGSPVNLWYTDARARAAVSATDAGGDGSFSYNSGTGVFTYTGPSATEVRAHLSAGTGLTYTSGAFAIDSTVATLTGSQTLTNKTLTTPVIAEIDSAADITLDAAGDIILDADGADVLLKDGGTTFGAFTQSGGELVIKSGATPTSAITMSGADVTIAGNLTVSGTTTTVNSNTVTIGDNILVLNSDEAGTPSQNAGIEVERGTSTNASITWDESTDSWGAGLAGAEVPLVTTSGTQTLTNKTIDGSQLVAGSVANAKLTNSTISGKALGTNLDTLTMGVSGTGLSGSATYNGSGASTFTVTSNATNANTVSTIVARDASGNFSAGTITATLSGNASTASAWATGRTLSLTGDVTGTSASFDGSGNISIATTIAADSVALGTDTTGNYVASITNGSYITGGNGGSEGAGLTLAVDATSANTASKVVARDASGNFSAGTITAALSGNASTATTLATARNIQGVSFNGSADITVVTAGTGVSVSGTAVSIGQAVATSSNVTFANMTSTGVLTVSNGSTTANGIKFGADPGGGSGDIAQINYYASAGESTILHLQVDNDADDYIKLDASGGTDNVGAFRATGEITAYYSDERLKNFSGKIEGALDKVMNLNGFYYTENDLAKSFGFNNDKQQVGVSAQQVQAVLPEAVRVAPFVRDVETDIEYLTVQYEKLVPLLIEAIKEQQKKIEELEAKINKQ